MYDVPISIRKYFTRKEHFRRLADWSTKMDELYKQFPFLRNLMVEDIDLKESPSMNYQNIQRNLLAKAGVRIETVEGETKITHDPAAMNLEGLTPLVGCMISQAILNKTITDSDTLNKIIQTHYSNLILKQRARNPPDPYTKPPNNKSRRREIFLVFLNPCSRRSCNLQHS